MAAASIGQVHRAVLPNGRRVAVKVQRPDAPRQIEADIALLYQAARLAKDRVRGSTSSTRAEIVDEFARSIRQELDYRSRRATRSSSTGTSPATRTSACRASTGATRGRGCSRSSTSTASSSPTSGSRRRGVERRRLAEIMTETWMTMIFRNGFFHGDPHPANILVLGRRTSIGLVDFGLAGKLTDADMSKLTRLFIDAANENVDALPKRLAELGVRYPKEREAEFTRRCASSSIATTARGCRRSTRCR